MTESDPDRPATGWRIANSAHTQVPTMLDELHSVCILAHSRERSGYVGRTRIFRSAQLFKSATVKRSLSHGRNPDP